MKLYRIHDYHVTALTDCLTPTGPRCRPATHCLPSRPPNYKPPASFLRYLAVLAVLAVVAAETIMNILDPKTLGNGENE